MYFPWVVSNTGYTVYMTLIFCQSLEASSDLLTDLLRGGGGGGGGGGGLFQLEPVSFIFCLVKSRLFHYQINKLDFFTG